MDGKEVSKAARAAVSAWLMRRLRELDMSGAELARRVGVDPSAVSNWIHGKDLPRPETVRLIAIATETDDRWLQGLAGYLVAVPEPPPTRPRSMPDLLRDVQKAYDAATHGQFIDHLGAAGASVGGGVNADTGEPGRRFSLTIEGDCLTPDIPPGSLVIFDRERSIRPGVIVAAIIDGERQVKRLVTKNGILTLADNYGQVVKTEGEARIIGVFEQCYLPKEA